MSFEVIEEIISTTTNPGDAIRQIKTIFGASSIYIPALDNAARNENILKDFKGNNHREICETYDISMTTLWRIIRKRDL